MTTKKKEESEPAIVYTFEEILAAKDFPKAYTRSFVVVEKYNEVKDRLEEIISYLPKVPTEPYEKMLAKEANKLREEVEYTKDFMKRMKSHFPSDSAGFACMYCDMGQAGYSALGDGTHDNKCPYRAIQTYEETYGKLDDE